MQLVWSEESPSVLGGYQWPILTSRSSSTVITTWARLARKALRLRCITRNIQMIRPAVGSINGSVPGMETKRMIRKAFVMQVNSDQHEEYRKRHNPIWPELEDTLKSHGVLNYSIFLHPETSQLFAYVEIEDESRWQSIAQTDACQKWWAHMRQIMSSNPDNSPRLKDLKEVFHIDAQGV
jgi:L-rhamnose mutarotase